LKEEFEKEILEAQEQERLAIVELNKKSKERIEMNKKMEGEKFE